VLEEEEDVVVVVELELDTAEILIGLPPCTIYVV
jgi:hypothetical protein